MRIAYLDGPRLRRSLLAACAYAQHQRRELNRINVFPVPDGDTGTNLSLTLQAIADRLGKSRDRAVDAVAQQAAQAAILGARGNAGMMLSHFLLGFADGTRGKSRITAREFGDALVRGAAHLHSAIERPVEGTILTVMRDTARAALESSFRDFQQLMAYLVERARASLARTPDLLPVLKRSGVVDAGAKGFVSLLEGVKLYIDGSAPSLLGAPPPPEEEVAPVAQVEYPAMEERYRFCTEALVEGEGLPDQGTVRDALREAGDSLIVIRTDGVLKIHIHTDDPEGVFAYLRSVGRLVTHKAEDMEVQHAAAARAAEGHLTLARRPVGVVTDSASDLPEEIVRAHGIKVVPLVLVRGEENLRDGIDVTAEEFHRALEEGGELPTTSQPPPGAFLEAYARAGEEAEEVVAVILGSNLSGTYRSAEAAASRFGEAPVHLMDSGGASLLQGLLTLKAAELAESGWAPEAIVSELERVRGQSGLILTVDSFERLLASGRVGRGKAWLASALGLKPLLEVPKEGRAIRSAGRALGRRRALRKVLSTVRKRIPTGARKVRFGIIHVGAPDIVPVVSAALWAEYGDVEILSAAATPVLATHVGTGAWAVAYLVED